ncbi:MAG: FAD-binding protein [Planctomycetes bacterium]|nr:FAD-binding protein [Planctomycetota bacterium]
MGKNAIIVGSGLAGYALAYKLRKRGEPVTVVTTKKRATSFFSGAFDVARMSYAGCNFASSMEVNIEECVQSTLRTNPDHPYKRISTDERVIVRLLRENLGLFGPLARAGFEVTMPGMKNLAAVTSIGTIHPALMFASSVSPMEIEDVIHGRTIFAGIRGHRDFVAEFASKTFDEVREKVFGDGVMASKAYEFSLKRRTSSAGLSNAMLAMALDDPVEFENLIGGLRRVRDELHPTMFVIPCAVGVSRFDAHLAKLRSELGNVTLALPMIDSLNGVRLTNAIDVALVDLEVEIVAGRATNIDFERGAAIIDGGGGRSFEREYDRLFVCSGKYVGGGLEVDRHGVHSLLSSEEPAPEMIESGAKSFADNFAPMMKGAFERDLPANVRIAGSAISGLDHATSGCSAGIAILTSLSASQF